MSRAAAEAHARFRTAWSGALNDEQAFGIGLVWVEEEARWSFTENRAALVGGLNALLSTSYMQPVNRRSFPRPSADRAYAWDLARLEQAAGLQEARRKFDSEVLTRLPEALRADADRLARQALAEAIVDATVQAMVPAPLSVNMLGEGERTLLGRIRVNLLDLGAQPAATQLVMLLAQDAMARLQLVDDAWRAAEPYAPIDRALETWAGDRPPMLDVYGVEDQNALNAHIALQQSRVLQLAKDAEAIVSSLEANTKGPQRPPVVQEALIRKWRGIITEAERLKAKSANSSIAQLEQFVLATASDVDLANCGDKLLTKVPNRRGTDPFNEQLRRLHGELVQRCRTLRVQELKSLWASFREVYNREIAGRSPFILPAAGGPAQDLAMMTPVALQPGSALGLAGSRVALMPEEVLTLLGRHERIQRLMKDKLLENAGKHVAGAAVLRFGSQLDAVRQFMAPLAPNDEGSPAGFDVLVELRAGAGDEIEGNKFIEWSLSVGTQTQTQRDAIKPLRWVPGMPVEFSLRAARQAQLLPVADLSLPGMTVDDTVVRFTFNDPWALFTLLQQYRDPDRRSGDERSPLLRFEFPVQKREAEKGPSVLGKARVYVRLSVSPAGKRTALYWPAVFPARAPEWASP